MPDLPDSSLPCRVMVGFLFKRMCGRTNRIGCQYCKGQVIPADTNVWDPSYDPYYMDRIQYPRYGNYDSQWHSSFNITHRDFTDADANTLHQERDTDYEHDLDAS